MFLFSGRLDIKWIDIVIQNISPEKINQLNKNRHFINILFLYLSSLPPTTFSSISCFNPQHLFLCVLPYVEDGEDRAVLLLLSIHRCDWSRVWNHLCHLVENFSQIAVKPVTEQYWKKKKEERRKKKRTHREIDAVVTTVGVKLIETKKDSKSLLILEEIVVTRSWGLYLKSKSNIFQKHFLFREQIMLSRNLKSNQLIDLEQQC